MWPSLENDGFFVHALGLFLFCLFFWVLSALSIGVLIPVGIVTAVVWFFSRKAQGKL